MNSGTAPRRKLTRVPSAPRASTKGQITAHLHASERADFEAYARRFGLDPAGLLVLLLAREMRVERLSVLLKADLPSSEARSTKVTIHKQTPALREGIAVMASEHGTSVSHACAVLIRAELKEQWLDNVITTRFESH
jgi:hypothetical protein